MESRDLRGIVHARQGLEQFDLGRLAPAPELAPWVEHYWTIRYALAPGVVHVQTVLSFPNLHLAFERAPEPRALLYGVPARPFQRRLEGQGEVLGVRFRPGGLAGFTPRPAAAWTGRAVDAAEVFGPGVTELIGARTADVVDEFLLSRKPTRSDEAEGAARIVDEIRDDPTLTRVEEVAVRAGLSVRHLQRRFHQYVGVSPKWVLRRFRLQEAALVLETDPGVDWADFALRLGYFDQSHFVNDFRAVLGVTPTEYRRRLTSSPDRPEGR